IARGQHGRSETGRTEVWRTPPPHRLPSGGPCGAEAHSLQTLRAGFSRRDGHARERRMQETRPRGMLTAAELRELVGREEIETVLAVFADLYGRLVGNRITGHYFCDEILEHGMHACDYLLACDMEMDPVPGYRFASWADGYGDVH